MCSAVTGDMEEEEEEEEETAGEERILREEEEEERCGVDPVREARSAEVRERSSVNPLACPLAAARSAEVVSRRARVMEVFCRRVWIVRISVVSVVEEEEEEEEGAKRVG